MVTACESRTSTPDYQARVNDSLKNAKIENVKADWKKDEQALHLTGDADPRPTRLARKSWRSRSLARAAVSSTK